MKTISIFKSALAVSIMFMVSTANAELIVQGDDPYAPWDWVVIDTNTNLMWHLDANEPESYGYTDGLMTDQETNNWINSYTAAGYYDWRLPTVSEFQNLFNVENITISTPSPFINLQDMYWTSDSYLGPEGRIIYVEVFNFINGGVRSSDVSLDDKKFHALTVRTIIPIPAAVWLFGSGIVGLIGVARRKKS